MVCVTRSTRVCRASREFGKFVSHLGCHRWFCGSAATEPQNREQDAVLETLLLLEPVVGVEPTTCCLRNSLKTIVAVRYTAMGSEMNQHLHVFLCPFLGARTWQRGLNHTAPTYDCAAPVVDLDEPRPAALASNIPYIQERMERYRKRPPSVLKHIRDQLYVEQNLCRQCCGTSLA
jgi:hypothetical protein